MAPMLTLFCLVIDNQKKWYCRSLRQIEELSVYWETSPKKGHLHLIVQVPFQLSNLGVEHLDYEEEALLFRDEYILAHKAIKEWSKMRRTQKSGGVVITGHPGLDERRKTCFLLYLLFHRLSKGLPTAFQFLPDSFVLFTDSGVKVNAHTFGDFQMNVEKCFHRANKLPDEKRYKTWRKEYKAYTMSLSEYRPIAIMRIETSYLNRFVIEAIAAQDLLQQSEFYFGVSHHSSFKGSAGYMFDMAVLSWLCANSESKELACTPARSVSKALPAVDAMIFTDDHIITIQVTIAPEYSVKSKGLLQIANSLAKGFRQSRKWCHVFVTIGRRMQKDEEKWKESRVMKDIEIFEEDETAEVVEEAENSEFRWTKIELTWATDQIVGI
ncbi:hypothetical protein B0F90DRAFT_1919658 [Multifurca ochricompacta]|uniref:Uncharacterized protein n=1 Tax=Multifurca ochricompacta TaxID=376703 RepID=A0AAD4LXQ3_9AGAM|nr:hypothetical protein B0F90DRAFT_1919658 [Multifurca ochricompacta]